MGGAPAATREGTGDGGLLRSTEETRNSLAATPRGDLCPPRDLEKASKLPRPLPWGSSEHSESCLPAWKISFDD